MRTLVLCLCLCALWPGLIWSQAEEPQEYEEQEFAPWMLKLRRGEIVLFGSLPFSMFFVSFGYDLYRYAVHFGDEDRSRYAPWPFRGGNSIPYRSAENVGVMVGAVLASLVFAVTDFAIGEIRGGPSEAP